MPHQQRFVCRAELEWILDRGNGTTSSGCRLATGAGNDADGVINRLDTEAMGGDWTGTAFQWEGHRATTSDDSGDVRRLGTLLRGGAPCICPHDVRRDRRVLRHDQTIDL